MIYLRVARRVLGVGIAAALTACLPIPHTHTKQPAAAFFLRDTVGKPAIGGRVRLYAGIIVGQHVQFADSATTNERGVATFEERSEWHWFVFLLPDGEAPWVWGWCAEVPGMAVEYGRLERPPSDTILVTLRAAHDTSNARCPSRPNSLYDLPVKH